MTTIATIAADRQTISIGGGWIVLMLVGMGLCFGLMWLMRDGRGWSMCGRSWQQTPSRDVLTGPPGHGPDRAVSPESEA